MRDDSDPFAELIELQPAWVKTFDLPGGDGAHWAILPNSDSVEIHAEVVQPTVNVWSFGVWYWPEALAVVLALLVLATGRWWWLARRGKEPRCRKCRYELTKLKSDACPECGAALTQRNRVIGMRSRWRMALAPAALLVIGSAWWFGESHVPRHGWVSEKVQWHWAIHQDSIGPPGLFHTYQWYVLHGGERLSRTSIDVANAGLTMTSSAQMAGTMRHWECSITFRDEMRAWGRFDGSESIWHVDANGCRITKYDAKGSKTFAIPFCSSETWVTFINKNLGADGNYLSVHTGDGDFSELPVLPDPSRDGWFILVGTEIVHYDLVKGAFTDVINLLDHVDTANHTLERWALRPVLGSESLAIVYGQHGYLIDLASRQIISEVDLQYIPNEVAIALIAAGATDVVVGNAQKPFGGWSGDRFITPNMDYLVSMSAPFGETIVAGSLQRAEWELHLVEPAVTTGNEGRLITTGPGPRDVNVFFIDGGQLILAVYELPEAE